MGQSDDSDNNDRTLEELSVVLLAGSAIILVCLLAVLVRCCVMACPKVRKCYEALKRALFYGTFIRYFLVSTLKTQMTLGLGLSIGYLVPETPANPRRSETFQTVAIALLTCL